MPINDHHISHVYQCWIIILIIHSIHSEQSYHILTVTSNPGFKYSPVNVSAQLISINYVDSFKTCLQICNRNSLCGVLDYGVNQFDECRLFEGDTIRLGSIIPSITSPQALVSSVRLSPNLFSSYGRSCSSAYSQNRYLQCDNNMTYGCMPHMYWNSSASMCYVQSPLLGGSCQTDMKMCRQDFDYICLQFNQCGPISFLDGKTIANVNTVVVNSGVVGLNSPCGITFVPSMNDSIIIADIMRNEIILVNNVESSNIQASLLIKIWSGSAPAFLNRSPFTMINPTRINDLYVSDYYNHRILLFSGMQSVNPLPQVIAGISSQSGSSVNNLNQPSGLAFDQFGNLFIADRLNHRIMLWLVNATGGIILAGSGTAGGGPQDLNLPFGIFFDERDSSIYVADQSNHRIQRISPNGTYPRNMTTVAGGNGNGRGRHQLNNPSAVWVSKKTGAIYIVDQYNSRIQRWNQGATEGVTIAGNPNGGYGANSTSLWSPCSLAINDNETKMYVTDQVNKRIQRFNLI